MRPPPVAERAGRDEPGEQVHLPISGAAGWAPARYVQQLWRGEAPLQRVFWTDMLAVGTLVNFAATLPAFILLANGAPALPAFGLHLLPLPYNILVLIGVWQSAGQSAWSWGFRLIAVAWFVAAVLL